MKSNLLATEYFTLDNQVLAASTSVGLAFDVSKEGYTPIGVIGWRIGTATEASGTTSLLNVYNVYLTGTTVTMSERNTGTSSVTFMARVYVLYVANDGTVISSQGSGPVIQSTDDPDSPTVDDPDGSPTPQD